MDAASLKRMSTCNAAVEARGFLSVRRTPLPCKRLRADRRGRNRSPEDGADKPCVRDIAVAAELTLISALPAE